MTSTFQGGVTIRHGYNKECQSYISFDMWFWILDLSEQDKPKPLIEKQNIKAYIQYPDCFYLEETIDGFLIRFFDFEFILRETNRHYVFSSSNGQTYRIPINKYNTDRITGFLDGLEMTLQPLTLKYDLVKVFNVGLWKNK